MAARESGVSYDDDDADSSGDEGLVDFNIDIPLSPATRRRLDEADKARDEAAKRKRTRDIADAVEAEKKQRRIADDLEKIAEHKRKAQQLQRELDAFQHATRLAVPLTIPSDETIVLTHAEAVRHRESLSRYEFLTFNNGIWAFQAWSDVMYHTLKNYVESWEKKRLLSSTLSERHAAAQHWARNACLYRWDNLPVKALWGEKPYTATLHLKTAWYDRYKEVIASACASCRFMFDHAVYLTAYDAESKAALTIQRSAVLTCAMLESLQAQASAETLPARLALFTAAARATAAGWGLEGGLADMEDWPFD